MAYFERGVLAKGEEGLSLEEGCDMGGVSQEGAAPVIDKKFQKETIALERLWLTVKKICDEKEGLSGVGERVEFIDRLRAEYFPGFIEHFLRLNALVVALDEKTYEAYKKFIRVHLCPLMVDPHAPLNKQVNDKPLGYAGDFIIANYFYENGYSGKSLWGMLMDRFTVESPLATAHRNRRKYISGVIERLARRKKSGDLLATSFACGPAPEVFDTFSKNIGNVRFTLLDGEPLVLKFLAKKMGAHKKYADRVRTIQANIINLVRKDEMLAVPPQDLVYCAGFFDYIRPMTATKFIRYMLKHIKPGGWLIVVNVSMHDEKDVCLKMLADWDLYHRTKPDLLALMNGVEGVAHKKAWADFQTKRNLYLIVRKS